MWAGALFHGALLATGLVAAVLVGRHHSQRAAWAVGVGALVTLIVAAVLCAIPLRGIGYFPVVPRTDSTTCQQASGLTICAVPENKAVLRGAMPVVAELVGTWSDPALRLPSTVSEIPGHDTTANVLRLPAGTFSRTDVAWSLSSALVTPACLTGKDSLPVVFQQRQLTVQAYLLAAALDGRVLTIDRSAFDIPAEAWKAADSWAAQTPEKQISTVNAQLAQLQNCS